METEHGKGIIFIFFILLETLGKRRIWGNLCKLGGGGSPSDFLVIMVQSGGATVSDEGQPLHCDWEPSSVEPFWKLFAGIDQDPLKKKKKLLAFDPLI